MTLWVNDVYSDYMDRVFAYRRRMVAKMQILAPLANIDDGDMMFIHLQNSLVLEAQGKPWDRVNYKYIHEMQALNESWLKMRQLVYRWRNRKLIECGFRQQQNQ